MRIKKFVDEDMIRLMRRVKEELGPDAVIVSTSRAEDGRTELVAAVESEEICFNQNEQAEIYSAAYSDAKIRESLSYHETGDECSARLLSLCRQQAAQSGESDDLKILTAVFDGLFARFDVLATDHPVKMFVGVQGSGKTTALIKTAAWAKFHGKSAAVIGTDSHRAGADSQLRALSAVLQADFQSVRDPEKLPAAIEAVGCNNDLVLIDTPGCNPFAATERDVLSALIAAAGDKAETILTLDAGYNAYDAGETAAFYTDLGAGCLLPTKLDLCRRIGGVLTAAESRRLKLGWASVSGHMSKGLSVLDNPSLARLLLASG